MVGGLAPKLNLLGITTVLDLKQTSPARMCSSFSVVMEKIIRELNDITCIELEEIDSPRKQIASSRSFGMPVSDLASLEESVSCYTSRAAEKLRRQQSHAGAIHVSIRTSPFNEKKSYYANGLIIPVPMQTDDTIVLTKAALWGLRRIYRRGYKYQKAGVILSELVSNDYLQHGLFDSVSQDSKSRKLIDIMDQINANLGRGTIKLVSEGIRQPWKMKQENRSPGYTTKWDELMCIG